MTIALQFLQTHRFTVITCPLLYSSYESIVLQVLHAHCFKVLTDTQIHSRFLQAYNSFTIRIYIYSVAVVIGLNLHSNSKVNDSSKNPCNHILLPVVWSVSGPVFSVGVGPWCMLNLKLEVWLNWQPGNLNWSFSKLHCITETEIGKTWRDMSISVFF
jgi:hypothetical protein